MFQQQQQKTNKKDYLNFYVPTRTHNAFVLWTFELCLQTLGTNFFTI